MRRIQVIGLSAAVILMAAFVGCNRSIGVSPTMIAPPAPTSTPIAFSSGIWNIILPTAGGPATYPANIIEGGSVLNATVTIGGVGYLLTGSISGASITLSGNGILITGTTTGTSITGTEKYTGTGLGLSNGPASGVYVGSGSAQTSTFTQTITASFTATPSLTNTLTPTPTGAKTVTPSPTNTNVSTGTWTVTILPTGTSTFSPTLTGTNTQVPVLSFTYTLTPTPTGTSTVTATTTPTITITSTPGITLTPYPVGVCGTAPSAFQGNYNFNSGIQCWTAKVDSGTNYITGFGTTNEVQYNGQNSLVVSVNNPTGSTVTVSIDFIIAIATNQVLTGGSISGYAMVDSNLMSGGPQAQAYNISDGVTPPTYNFDDANNNWPNVLSTGWVQTTQSAVVNTDTQQVGIQVFKVAIPAGQSGNIYLADVTINAPTIPTNTITATPTQTPTITQTPTTTPTVTITSTPGITLTPYPVGVCGTAPSAFQANYNFNSGIQCWTAKVDSGTNYITGFGTTNEVQYNGQNTLVVSVNNPTGSTVTVSIDFIIAIATNQVLTGGSISGYAMVDSNLMSGGPQAQAYNISDGVTPPTYNFDDANNNWPNVLSTGWVQTTQSAVVNTETQQVGIQVFKVAIPAGQSGNIYLADVNINIPTVSTPTATATPTLTSTPTATITSTPGITLTPYANVTPCAVAPAVFQANYNFTSGTQCWTAKVDSGTNYITGFGTTSDIQYNGQNSLVVSVNNPTGSTVTVSIDFIIAIATNQVLTGGSISGYAMVDSNLMSGGPQAQAYNISDGVTPPTYNFDDANNNWPNVLSTGWVQTTQSAVVNTETQQVGIQVFKVAIPAGQSGNIYLADVSITSSTIPTATITATPTPTGTPTPTSTPTMTSSPTSTATITNTPGITLTPYPVGVCGSAPAAFLSNYNFTAGIQCWTAKVDSGTNYITGFGTTSEVQYNGQNTLVVNVTNPTGSTVTVSIDFIIAIATSQVMTGGSISGYAMVDSNLTTGSPQAQAYNISNGVTPPTYNFDDANNNWPSITSTAFAQAIQSSVVNTNTQQVGIQVFNVAIPAGQSGNIYLADVNITSPNTPTITATPTVTGTPTITNTTIPGATVTNTPTVTSTNTTVPATACTVLFNACDTLLDNGNWTTTSANDAAPVITSSHSTQGTGAIQVDVTNPTNYNQFLKLNSVDPSNWSGVSFVLVDVYVDSTIPAGTTYCQLTLAADTTGGPYGSSICPNAPTLVPGQQTVAIPINFSAGTIPVGSPLSGLYFILNCGGTTPANAGNIYIDNVRLVYANSNSPANLCGPVPVYSANFDDNSTDGWAKNNWFSGSAGEVLSVVSPGYPGAGYCLNDYVPFTAGGQQEALAYTFPAATDLTGRTLQADLWIDSSINSGYPGGYLFVQSGAWIEEQGPGSWNNLTPNAWNRITFTPTWTVTAGEDSTNVLQVGAIFSTGSGTIGAGNVKVDNFIIY